MTNRSASTTEANRDWGAWLQVLLAYQAQNGVIRPEALRDAEESRLGRVLVHHRKPWRTVRAAQEVIDFLEASCPPFSSPISPRSSNRSSGEHR